MNTEVQTVTLIIDASQFPPTDDEIMRGVDQAMHLIKDRLTELQLDAPEGTEAFPDPPLGLHFKLSHVGCPPDGQDGFSVSFFVHHGEERTNRTDEVCALWAAMAWTTMHACEARTFDKPLLSGWYDVDGEVQVRDMRCPS
jgi:hypothetical protein